MLCTSGFMDDVTFGRTGPYGDSSVPILGRSLMSMNALFVFGFQSCATACMHDKYLICSGDDVIDVWKPFRGW